MIFLLLLVIFIFLLLLPFISSIRELVSPRDSASLRIDMEYCKDPRYFGTSFRDIVRKAVEPKIKNEGEISVKLSKDEIVEIAAEKSIPPGETIDHVLYIKDRFKSHQHGTFTKEIYVAGNANVGEENELRALAADGRITLDRKTKVTRWIDSEGNIIAGEDCDLGWSASCGGKLTISSGCQFRRLYGLPVATRERSPKDTPSFHPKGIEEIGDTALVIGEEWFILPPSTTFDKVVISKQNLLIKKKCVLKSDVKTYGNLVLEEGVKVAGNIFTEGNIDIKKSSRVFGNVFSQGALHIGDHVKIGREGMVKSVVSRKDILLCSGVLIFGYVSSGSGGKVQ